MSAISYSRTELQAVLERFKRSIEQDRESYLMTGNKMTLERILFETARCNKFLKLLSEDLEQQEFNI